ncbi:hypothetical protein OE88DRAFT_1668442 [Heliocybe sulcata]|uniref:Uncharacterized protein n=1 Tax=Heliocybe sulcata TaxID=5364 RepID=A0A5C3MX37_9AGAM|nr:hypothetical protein OE88DRAFT_1668442 [Heliocybe sulcata]
MKEGPESKQALIKNGAHSSSVLICIRIAADIARGLENYHTRVTVHRRIRLRGI